MDEKELLDKLYDKYQMEISRKDRIESKSIGYYTIIGIFLAAFLVIEPILLEKGLLMRFELKDFLATFNCIIVFLFILLFIISIVILHKNYKPKKRKEFDPIENWDILKSASKQDSLNAIKEELIQIVKDYEKQNEIFSSRLIVVNRFCLIMAFLIIISFFSLIALFYINYTR